MSDLEKHAREYLLHGPFWDGFRSATPIVLALHLIFSVMLLVYASDFLSYVAAAMYTAVSLITAKYVWKKEAQDE